MKPKKKTYFCSTQILSILTLSVFHNSTVLLQYPCFGTTNPWKQRESPPSHTSLYYRMSEYANRVCKPSIASVCGVLTIIQLVY